jgi:transcriptional regulator with XRE-family HTH domain
MNVLEWLLDSDPAIRWQVMRDLTGDSVKAVTAERAKVATEGWGEKLLSLQDSNGQWGTNVVPAKTPTGELPDVATRKLLRDLHGVSLEEMAGFLGVGAATLSEWEEGRPTEDDEGIEKYRSALAWMRNALGTYSPKWISTTFTLLLLRDMGLDPASREARKAVSLVRENSKWEQGGQDYFDGEVEPCINGMAVAIGSYFGENVDGIVERLLGEQLADGGWNCEAERGSIRGSFDTSISVLEGLLEYERANGASASIAEVRRTGEEYLLERRLLRRLSTGEVIDPTWTHFSYPPRWHYDVLRGLDYFRSTGAKPDERSAEAIELVETKCQPDGRWLLENTHPGRVHFEMDEGDGKPSRWNTLRAMRVLAWAGRHSI